MISCSLNSFCFSPSSNMITVGKLLPGISRAMGESGTQYGWLFRTWLNTWNPYLNHHFIQQCSKCEFKQESIRSHSSLEEMRSFEEATDHILACMLFWRLQSNQPDYGSQQGIWLTLIGTAIQVFPWLLVPV